MKKVLLGTLAVLTLAACSKDEVIQQNPNDEISFSVVTNKAVSRAADGYCNLTKPANMVVSALYTTDGSTWKTYFTNETYTKGTGSIYAITGSALRYWPDLGTDADNVKMKFFAMVNATPAWDGTTGMKVENFTVESTVSAQKDVLYAVQEVAKKPDGAQAINFRHALSKIEFKAKNENKNIYVVISRVKVCNVNSKGNFKFSASTVGNIDIHESTGSYPAEVGKWSAWSNLTSYETATFGPVKLSQKKYEGETLKTPEEAAEASPLTISGEYNANTMYLLPQKFELYTGTGTDDPNLTNVWNGSGKPESGAYFLVETKIQNVAAGNGTRAAVDDVYLWGNSTTAKYIAVPMPKETNWEPGKRYVYTFVFTTDGNGGTDPEKGEPVLVPIKLNVTVDDFVDGGNKDVTMNK